jgi:hypothetical protein
MGNTSHDTCHDTCQTQAMTPRWQKDAQTTDNRLKDLRPKDERPKTVSRPAPPGMADESSPEGSRRSVVTTAHSHHRATGGAR